MAAFLPVNRWRIVSVSIDDVCHVGALDAVADVGLLRKRVAALCALFATDDFPIRDVVLIAHHTLDLPRGPTPLRTARGTQPPGRHRRDQR